MKSAPITTSALVLGLFAAATCLAQTPSPPASNTNPSAASSPSQRDATRSPAAETPANSQSKPSDASTPHQHEAMAGKNQTMKECTDAQAAKNPSMSKADITKACDDQMKMQKDRARLSKSPDSAPSDRSQTPAPK